MSDAPQVAEEKTTTLSGWKKAAYHTPLLYSGVRVKIKIPDLPAMILAGEIPQHLLDAAMGVAKADEDTQQNSLELIKNEREFTDKLVQLTVQDPKLSDADVAEIPYEDKVLIVALATRQRDTDAEGEHLAGLNKSEKFRQFREIGEFATSLEGV